MRAFLLECSYSTGRHTYATDNSTPPNNWSSSGYKMLVHAENLDQAKEKFLEHVWKEAHHDDWYKNT
jgi:hypothetical protein